MANKNEKWVMFRNLIFNEMGITKEDIREWINEAVKEQAKLIVAETFARVNPEAMIKRAVYDENCFSKGFTREVTDKAAKLLADRIELKVKQ